MLIYLSNDCNKMLIFNTKPPAAARCRIISCPEKFEKEILPEFEKLYPGEATARLEQQFYQK